MKKLLTGVKNTFSAGKVVKHRKSNSRKYWILNETAENFLILHALFVYICPVEENTGFGIGCPKSTLPI